MPRLNRDEAWEITKTLDVLTSLLALLFSRIFNRTRRCSHNDLRIFASLLLGVMVACGSGIRTSPPATASSPGPSGLVYPHPSITAVVGQAITPDIPTISGTVASYGVSPALPGGLNLDTANGTISGTPTAVAAQSNYIVTAENGSGSTSATLQISVMIAAPANLDYPQGTITGIVGQAITSDTPTVSGTVDSYVVSPALPAGLSLNTSTGTISGTPIAVAKQSAYVVTAGNAIGSTSATLEIAVNIAAPSSLVYPQGTITATVGQAITPDIPTISGTVGSYGVSPALPGGLILDSTTGTLSGIPMVAAAQTAYTVTATNSSGSAASVLTITVMKAPNTLLELGHAAGIQTLRFSGGHLLSADASGHWVLWDYSSRALLAIGDGTIPYQNCNPGDHAPCPVRPYPARYANLADMAGQTFVVAVSNGLEIRAQSDGHLVSLIVFPGLNLFGRDPTTSSWFDQFDNWWQLASDGSYICIGSKSGLFIYAPTGEILVSKPGDYSLALSFSAPDAVRVALGPAGNNVIEAISIVDGTSTLSKPFSGMFNSWFVDGSRFLTNQSTTVWVYSNTGEQQANVALPTVTNLGGEGSWIWTFDPTGSTIYPPRNPMNIYAIGSETPTLTINDWTGATIIPSKSTLGVLSDAIVVKPSRVEMTYQFSVLDLSSSIPSRTDYTFPVAYGASFTAVSSSVWVAGNGYGAILDGASLSSSPQFFGHGEVWSIAGALSTVAISTAIGEVLVFDSNLQTLEETIPFSSGKLALSTNGSVLGASGFASDEDYLPDRTLNFYSLPSSSLISSFPYANPEQNDVSPDLFDFTLSASGSTIGQVTGIFQSPTWTYSRKVSDITGGAVIWSDTGTSSIAHPFFYPAYINSPLLSPDGTLIAVTAGAPARDSVTNIRKNGGLSASVPGVPIGWLDNDRLLVEHFAFDASGTNLLYAGCAVYSSAGEQLATPPLSSALSHMQIATTDSVYDPDSNTIYSLSTGEKIWQGNFPLTSLPNPDIGPAGAVTGSYVFYESGHRVVREAF